MKMLDRAKAALGAWSDFGRGDLRVVRSAGYLPDIPEWSLSRWERFPSTRAYEQIWRSQPWVRTAVDFLSRNIAQVGLHVFERGDDGSRERLREHPFARVLAQPDPHSRPPMTAYGLIYGVVQDLGTYGNAFVLKMPSDDPPLRLRRLEVQRIYQATTDRDELELRYRHPNGRDVRIDLNRTVWLRYLSPLGKMGESPIESLRQLLDEYFESAEYRRQLWRNGARMSGWVERPLEAPEWGDDGRQRFETDWKAHWSGASSEAGGTPVLEEGMKFHREVFSAEEAQYLDARKLSREEVAAAYFIPPTMLGVTAGATYSNTREHHVMLYQDTLGPPMAGIEQEFMAQLLPDFAEIADVGRVYCEFNIAEKLQGNFEEQTRALQSATGRPWMSANEARTRVNMPRVDDPAADSLVVPLNVLLGGQASPTDTAPPPAETYALAQPAPRQLVRAPAALPAMKSEAELARRQAELANRLRSIFGRQEAALADLLAGASLLELWDSTYWDAELSGELLRNTFAMSSMSAADVLDVYGSPEVAWSDDRLLPWLAVYAGSAAAAINIVTRRRVVEAVLSLDIEVRLEQLWEWSRGARSDQIALTSSTAARNFGQHEAAAQSGLRFKTWRVTSSRPRPSHAAMNGERVPVTEAFSNGARWPGDSVLAVEERANCTCRLEYSRTED